MDLMPRLVDRVVVVVPAAFELLPLLRLQLAHTQLWLVQAVRGLVKEGQMEQVQHLTHRQAAVGVAVGQELH
jgi:hypothetical protein